MIGIPLCVDLDGTLILTDSLAESLLRAVREVNPVLLRLPFWLLKGRANMKHEFSRCVRPDFASLPLNHELVRYLHEQKKNGRRLILVTAADIGIARGMVEQMDGLFDDIIASEGRINLAGRHKAEELARRFGERGFDYAGNESRRDLAIWAISRRAIVVSDGPELARKAAELCEVEKSFIVPKRSLRDWVASLRPRV